MAEITLGGPKRAEVLKVNIGEESYSVPLAGSLTVKEAAGIDSDAKALAFIERHIPKKVLEGITVNDLNMLVKEWYKASTDNGDAPGES